VRRCGLLALAAALAGCASAAPETRWVAYSCEGGPELSVVFMEDRAQLSVAGGAPIELPRRPAASGFLFETPTHSIRGEGPALTYTVGRMVPIQCRRIST
jgi:hypothetical protein